MNPRLLRLQADYQKIQNEFAGHQYVTVKPASPLVPPDRYVVTFRVPGLRWNPYSGHPVVVNEHVAEIYLHADYPREKPRCVLTTQVWHPNFGTYICIGDHWAAGETLVDVIVQISDLLQYRAYNPKSPLNAAAARWAMENRSRFPIGNINILQPEPEISLDIPSPSRTEDDLGIELGAPAPHEPRITLG